MTTDTPALSSLIEQLHAVTEQGGWEWGVRCTFTNMPDASFDNWHRDREEAERSVRTSRLIGLYLDPNPFDLATWALIRRWHGPVEIVPEMSVPTSKEPRSHDRDR